MEEPLFAENRLFSPYFARKVNDLGERTTAEKEKWFYHWFFGLLNFRLP